MFSFRDLSVDLLPKADPATVPVTMRVAGREPGGAEQRRSSSRSSRRSAASPASTRCSAASARATRASRSEVRARARHQRRGAGRAREGGAGHPDLPPAGRAAGHHQGRSRTRIRSSASRVSGSLPLRALTEIADKQIRRAHRDGGRRRRGHDLRRPGARNPRRPRHREAERARADRRPRPRRHRRRRTSRCPAAASSRGTPS